MREYLTGATAGVVIAGVAFVIYVAATGDFDASSDLLPLVLTMIGAGAVIGTLAAVYIQRLEEGGLGR